MRVAPDGTSAMLFGELKADLFIAAACLASGESAGYR